MAAVPRPDRTLHCLRAKDWLGGIKNGALLELAEKEFDVFITGDPNLRFQQDASNYEIAIVVLHAPSTQLHQTLPLMPKVLVALPSLKPGQIVDVYP